MKKDIILSEVFYVRIRAVEALQRAGLPDAQNAEELRKLGTELDGMSLFYGRASTGSAYSSFAGLMRIVSTLVEWRTAVLDASPDADRFLRSAKERYQLWQSEYSAIQPAAALASTSQPIEQLASIREVAPLCKALAAIPLPIGVFAEGSGYLASKPITGEEKPEPTELAVAFLKFQIDSTPASELHHLTPNQVHDLEIEVRVSRWPEEAEQLQLAPITIEPDSTYDFPTFVFERPTGEPPYIMSLHGRALLKVAQGLQARPFEFKYAAEFLPAAVEQPVAVVGHRTLLIEGLDLKATSITGYTAIDQAILKIRDQLRRQSLISRDDLNDLLAILTPLCNLAGRAVQDAEFKEKWSEADFQRTVRAELRRRPEIGVELDEHAHASGGITDLSYHGIPIELKCESHSTLCLEDCERFVPQTASYAVAKSKKIGILCVLDCSPKTTSPLPAEAGIGLFNHSTPVGNVAICAVLIQGNLARPSSLS